SVSTAELPDMLEAHLPQPVDRAVVEAQPGDRQRGKRGFEIRVGNDAAGGQVRERPGGAYGAGYGAGDDEAECLQPPGEDGEHLFFAAEQVGNAGDVEPEIAVRSLIIENRDKRAGIGMPVGELAEQVGYLAAVHLACLEVGNLGAGI